MATAQPPGQHFHPLPVIGYPEEFYLKHVRDADLMGDTDAHMSWKVGQYVTLAMLPGKRWDERLKYFRHTLKHHCIPPAGSSAALQAFYQKLGDLVRRHASQEALRAIAHEHHEWTRRLHEGQSREMLREEAKLLFAATAGTDGHCPDWLTPDAWKQIRAARTQWR